MCTVNFTFAWTRTNWSKNNGKLERDSAKNLQNDNEISSKPTLNHHHIIHIQWKIHHLGDNKIKHHQRSKKNNQRWQGGSERKDSANHTDKKNKQRNLSLRTLFLKPRLTKKAKKRLTLSGKLIPNKIAKILNNMSQRFHDLAVADFNGPDNPNAWF